MHAVSTLVQNACAFVKYVLRKKKEMNLFPCSCSCGKHTSTKRMRIRKIRIEKKKNAKTRSGVLGATFDPKRERLIGP